MSFGDLHKIILYATVALGLMPLATSGELPMPFVVAAYGALVASWFYDAPLQRIQRHEFWWTAATVIALVVLALLGWSTGNYLLYAIFFAMIMVVTRLFQSRSSRDVFQLYGLTFMSMIAGAVINPTLIFIFIFVFYVVLLVWGLILLHLQRDIEGLADEQEALGERPRDLAWRARNLITGRFLAGSSMLALAIFACSLVIFFFFPRLGMGFFFSQGRAGQTVSGFADNIELGHFGTIKDNMAVVMRVEFPDDALNPNRRLRMRGISFDRYDGKTWRKSTPEPRQMFLRDADGHWETIEGAQTRRYSLPGVITRQSIYLEPMVMLGNRMLFGESRVMNLWMDNPDIDRFRRHPVSFFQDSAGDISTRVADNVALRYHVDSWSPVGVDERLRNARGAIPQEIGEAYLQLPDNLDPRVAELARQVTATAGSAFEKAVQIEKHLVSNYQYTVEGSGETTRPLEHFILERKAGHCEYFSSAMVIMLRTLGVPARPANGFFGGVYNEFGRFYTVRQADAHSWVEVWFPGFGWMTFDPTPASEVLVPRDDGVTATLEEWFDSLRLSWYKWVVEYDLEKQIEFFRGIGETLSGLRDVLPQPSGRVTSPRAWKKGVQEWAKRPSTWLWIATPIVLLLMWRFGLFALLWRRLKALLRREPASPGGLVGARYGRMLKALSRQGIGRRQDETPRELAQRLQTSGYAASDAVERLTDAYETVRYAEREPAPGAISELDRDLAAIRKVKTGSSLT